MNSIFKKRVMWLLLGNDILDNLGIWIRNLAILLFVGRRTEYDPIAIALVTLAELLPMFLFSLVGGAVADRWEPKRTIIAGGLSSALSMGLVAWAVAGGFWQGVFIAVAISAIASQFSQPSSMVVFKRNLASDEVPIAISIDQTAVSILVIIGPMIGTAIFLAFGIVGSLAAVVVIFLVSTLLALFLPARREEDAAKTKLDLASDIKDGARYLFSQRRLRILVLTLGFFGVGSGLVQPLDLLLVTKRLGLDDTFLQWLVTISGIGMIAGGLASSVATKLGDFRARMSLAFAVMAAALAGSYLSTNFALTASLHFASGMAIAFLQAGLSTVTLTWVREDYVGRINGLFVPIMTGTICLGSALSGPTVSLLGLVGTGLLAAAVTATGAMTLLSLRKADYAIEKREAAAS